MKTFNKRFNAQRAAKSALGKVAAEGKDFATSKNEASEWTWAAIDTQPAKNTRKPRKATGDPLTPPDFSAKTHERYRPRLATVVSLVEARDIEGLKRFHINPTSTSPKAIMRYRDRALTALTA